MLKNWTKNLFFKVNFVFEKSHLLCNFEHSKQPHAPQDRDAQRRHDVGVGQHHLGYRTDDHEAVETVEQRHEVTLREHRKFSQVKNFQEETSSIFILKRLLQSRPNYLCIKKCTYIFKILRYKFRSNLCNINTWSTG